MVAAKMLGYENSRKLLARMPIDADHTATARTRDTITKAMFTAGMKLFAGAYVKAGNNVYAYFYNYKTAMEIERGLDARHGGEMLYVFNNLRPDATDSDRAMASEMHLRWVNFIKTGDPNNGLYSPSKVIWPAYDAGSAMMLHFGNNVEAAAMPERDDMAFYEKMMYGE